MKAFQRRSTDVRHRWPRGRLGSHYKSVCLVNKWAWPVNFGFSSLPADTQYTHTQTAQSLFPALLWRPAPGLSGWLFWWGTAAPGDPGDGRRPAGLFRWERGFVWHNNVSSTPQYRCFDRGHCWNAAPLFVSHGYRGTDERDGLIERREHGEEEPRHAARPRPDPNRNTRPRVHST